MQNLDYAEERNLQSYGKFIPELLSRQLAAPGNWPDSMITTHLAETFKLETIYVLILQVEDDDYEQWKVRKRPLQQLCDTDADDNDDDADADAGEAAADDNDDDG